MAPDSQGVTQQTEQAEPRRKHRRSARRFYWHALTAAERKELVEARRVEGIDEEIAVLRLRLRQALQKEPQDLELMLRGMETLRRLLIARYKLSPADAEALAEGEERLLQELRSIVGKHEPED